MKEWSAYVKLQESYAVVTKHNRQRFSARYGVCNTANQFENRLIGKG